MTYLITGATGLVGAALVKDLLASGHSVNYFSSHRSSSLDSRASFHCWNRDAAPDFQGMPRLDAVVNLRGESIAQRWTSSVKKRIYHSRVAGTRQLVDGLAKLRYQPKVLVSASAVGYYGDGGNQILTEESPRGPGFLADVCASWEREAFRAGEYGIRVAITRIAPVLSAQGGALKMMLPLFRFGLGGKLGDGQQWMSWVTRNDLVRLLTFAAENDHVQGLLNACSPEPVRNVDFTKALGEAVHRPTFMPAPEFALKAALGEAAGFLLASQRVQPQRTQESGFGFESHNLAATLESLTK